MTQPARMHVHPVILAAGASADIYHGLDTKDVIVACYHGVEYVWEYSLWITNPNMVLVRAGRNPIDRVVVVG